MTWIFAAIAVAGAIASGAAAVNMVLTDKKAARREEALRRQGEAPNDEPRRRS